MRVLFIGGTGLISSAATSLAVESGHELYLLNRGLRSAVVPAGAKLLRADINQPAEVVRTIGSLHFDAVVNWIAFSPADIARDLELFRGRTGHYVFISSASVYQKPALDYLVREDTPLANPFWDYSRNKIAAEEALLRAVRAEAFPGTIVRPSLTYGDTLIPLVINSWSKSYTVVDRMRRGRKIIVPGDGNSLWTLTHHSDFAKGLVGLLGQARSVGHAFHITSDEVLTWDQIYRIVGRAAGCQPELIHIPTDFLLVCQAELEGSLRGDKAVSTVFDNRKIKRFVPSFQATTTFAEGMRRALAWFDSDASRQVVDVELENVWDRIIAAYETGVQTAREAFGT